MSIFIEMKYIFSILVDQVVKSEFNTAPARGRDKAVVKEYVKSVRYFLIFLLITSPARVIKNL